MIPVDFNCVLNGDERNSRVGASSCFADWVTRRGLIHLGYKGWRFTWNNGVIIETRRSARLDMKMCTNESRRQFHLADVKHIPHSYSDHYPLLIRLHGGQWDRLGLRPFKFQAAWLLHKGSLGGWRSSGAVRGTLLWH